ncbi:phosphomethylpyrimidine synthase ThiC [bacterium]|nr:phosphomethylpyrimidine synthase ThiC [bacterium]RQV95311.1 MAG: phosphomethylpyrimidine synthase ThiC [bacterium]
MTQMEAARAGRITDEMKVVAELEHVDIHHIQSAVAAGEVVILKNRNHTDVRPVGVGKGLRTKVNANIGTSTDCIDVEIEVEKARMAVKVGSDTIMDLSTGGDIEAIRKTIMKKVPIIVGTVPIYQTAIEAIDRKGALIHMMPEGLFSTLEKQAEEGVDFFTVHCGVTRSSIERLQKQGRIMDIVSRGGSFITTWMIANEQENPLYEHFDRLLEIAHAHDVTLSLGDGLRPGSLMDATDRAQVEELIILGELTKRAWEHGVQVMIEGPGHVPLDQIQTNIQMEKRLCCNAPFYVLGPVVTDVAAGYDHITAAIGGAVAAAAGADFLCYVTPGEHLKLPDLEDVRQGVIATRIAAHAGDIAKGYPSARDWDMEISRARKNLDWDNQIKLAIDPERARELRNNSHLKENDVCSMCGEYCAIKLVQESIRVKK